jgi:hypothetical protein
VAANKPEQKHHQTDTIQSSLHADLMDNLFLSRKTSLQRPAVIVSGGDLFILYVGAFHNRNKRLPLHGVIALADDGKPWTVLPQPKQ